MNWLVYFFLGIAAILFVITFLIPYIYSRKRKDVLSSEEKIKRILQEAKQLQHRLEKQGFTDITECYPK